jgi:hypothetical protein
VFSVHVVSVRPELGELGSFVLKGKSVPLSASSPEVGIVVGVEGAGSSIGRKPATSAVLSICGRFIDEAVVDSARVAAGGTQEF